MNRWIAGWRLTGLLVLLAGCTASGLAQEDPAAEFDRLDDQAWAHLRAGKYREMEAAALNLKNLGEGPLRERPVFLGRALRTLGVALQKQARYAEAEPLYRRSLVIREKALGPDHPDVAYPLNDLANLYNAQARYAEAEPLYKRSLAIREKVLGPDHPNVAHPLKGLAILYGKQARYAEAEPLIDRAIKVYDRAGLATIARKSSYSVRADVHWAQKRREAALADLRKAMELTEQVRARASGGERERATMFGEHAFVFEKMVAWQSELNHIPEALEALERGRARGLLDQIETRGLDLLAGVPENEAQTLRENEARAQGRLVAFQKQLELLASRKDLTTEQKKQQSERLCDEIRRAQSEVAQAYAAIRNASPAYRLAVGKDLKPVPLERLQSWVAGQDALLLEYLAGDKGGYVLIVRPEGKTRIEKLAIAEPQAKVLGVDAGPLTGERLSEALSNEQGTGVLDRLRTGQSPEAVRAAAPALAVLWEVLIPEAERTSIQAGKCKRLIVLPDGPMAKLPFETLVVRTGDKPEYLLDVAPAIQYAPSATILINLAERNEQSGVKDLNGREPVLTVGDCQYGQPSQRDNKNLLAQLAPRARYGTLGGQLSPLPNSAMETRWVSAVFGAAGTNVAWLQGELATEAAVRFNAPGRRVLHFACHGLVDESYGNLFGALALTPGPNQDDAGDDGFLTLAEVYGMNLKGCELAILSACDTNAGPEQQGEGVWALSRGFLVAGSRRVVASNWLVDDEAAASLTSYFCGAIAQAEKDGKSADYARALHDAKRWVRQQDKWKSPYYWGTFTIVGPN